MSGVRATLLRVIDASHHKGAKAEQSRDSGSHPVTQNTVCKQAGPRWIQACSNHLCPSIPRRTPQPTPPSQVAWSRSSFARGEERNRVCWSVALLLSPKKPCESSGAATPKSASWIVCWLLDPVDYAVQVFGNAPAMLSAIPVLVATSSSMSCRRYPTPRTKMANGDRNPEIEEIS